MPGATVIVPLARLISAILAPTRCPKAVAIFFSSDGGNSNVSPGNTAPLDAPPDFTTDAVHIHA
jgi:hypothetical protein